nr:hypothetical protein [Lachnospiraceae bacterium]
IDFRLSICAIFTNEQIYDLWDKLKPYIVVDSVEELEAEMDFSLPKEQFLIKNHIPDEDLPDEVCVGFSRMPDKIDLNLSNLGRKGRVGDYPFSDIDAFYVQSSKSYLGIDMTYFVDFKVFRHTKKIGVVRISELQEFAYKLEKITHSLVDNVLLDGWIPDSDIENDYIQYDGEHLEQTVL